MEIQTLLLVVLGFVLVAVVLLALPFFRRSNADDGAQQSAQLVELRTERDRLLVDLQRERDLGRAAAAESGRLQGRLGSMEAELANREVAAARSTQTAADHQARAETEAIAAKSAKATLADRETTLAGLRARILELQGESTRLRDQVSVTEKAHAEATANLTHSEATNAEMRLFLEQAQEKLRASFAELAAKVFDERGQLFEKNVKEATVQGRTDIETMLKPFADKLGEFRARIDVVYGEEAKERGALLGAVTELKTLNQSMADSANSLTRALKGSSKVRGDWGELMLESVLRGSGLEEGAHYERQSSTADDEGRVLRPDVIVRLPDNRVVVVDSKVNLVAWQEAMDNVDDPEFHGLALDRHVAGLRRHVKDLGDRNYPKAVGQHALDLTIAFIPIEGALSAALGRDAGLQGYAFEQRVVFASPNTLMALLKVVDRLWSRDKMQRQASEIGDAGGKVLDALLNFLADFDVVGKRLDDAGKAFASARNRLHESNQAVIPRARRLASLGARGKKPLTDELKDDGPELLPLRQQGEDVRGSGESS